MRPTLRAALSIALVTLPAAACAAPVTLDLPGDVSTAKTAYSCDGGVAVQAEYINAGDNALAVVTLEGAKVVMVNVIAASGAKYVGGRYEWWTVGTEATLRDLTKGDDDKGVGCRETK